MKKRIPIVMAAILTACGAAATSSDNSADAAGGKKSAGRERDQQAELDAYIKEAVEMESAVQNGGIPGCYGGEPCGEGSSSTGSGGDDWSGHYKGGGKFAGGDLNIKRADGARYSVAFEIGGQGCGGGVDGTGTANGNRMTMSVPVQSGYQQCRIVLDRQGSTLRASESGDCYLFYGGQCSFDGTYTRERSASAAPATKTVSAPSARAATQRASWLVGAWTIRGEPCGGFGTSFDADGTFTADSEKGTWTLAGNVLTVVTRANFVLGEEGETPVRNPRPVRSTVLSSAARAFSFRDGAGRVWNMVRCQ